VGNGVGAILLKEFLDTSIPSLLEKGPIVKNGLRMKIQNKLKAENDLNDHEVMVTVGANQAECSVDVLTGYRQVRRL
jgi:hypothetical protein